MIEEELPDELENDLDDIEPVGNESPVYIVLVVYNLSNLILFFY